MFKLTKKTVAILLLPLVLTTAAHAETSTEDRFYLGMDIMQNKLSLGDKSKELNQAFLDNLNSSGPLRKNELAANFFVGKRWGNIGTELGYTNIRESKYTITNLNSIKGRIDSYNLYVDGNYYHGITDSIELIGSAGLGRLTTATSGFIKDAGFEKNSKVGLRLGAGAQLQASESVAVRTMYRYQKGNDYLKNVSSFGIGIAYQI